MDIQNLEREFTYNGVRLGDPNPTFTLVQVRDFYATVYPEITTADIEGPKAVGNKNVYTFRRAVGTKGNISLAQMIADVAELLHANLLDEPDAEFIKTLQMAAELNQVVKIPAEWREHLQALHQQHCVAKAA